MSSNIGGISSKAIASKTLVSENTKEYLATNVGRMQEALDVQKPTTAEKAAKVATVVSVLGGVISAVFDIGDKISGKHDVCESNVKEDPRTIQADGETESVQPETSEGSV